MLIDSKDIDHVIESGGSACQPGGGTEGAFNEGVAGVGAMLDG